MQPGHGPVWRPLKRHDSHVAEQMVERAAELARDSHSQTRYAAVLVKDESLLAWGTNGVPFPGEDHCYCKFGEAGDHDRCRTHAEQRAITLAREGDGWRMLQGSKLIYVRLEADDSVRLESRTSAPGAAASRCPWAWRSGSSPCPRGWSVTPRPTTTRLPGSGGSGGR
jgi:Deoxycytidylate deaminase